MMRGSGKAILTLQEFSIVTRHHNINYSVDETCTGLVYPGKGDACQRMYRENWECVTTQPFLSFSGNITNNYLTYPGKLTT